MSACVPLSPPVISLQSVAKETGLREKWARRAWRQMGCLRPSRGRALLYQMNLERIRLKRKSGHFQEEAEAGADGDFPPQAGLDLTLFASVLTSSTSSHLWCTVSFAPSGSESSSFSGLRKAVNLPPKTHPVSILRAWFGRSGSVTGSRRAGNPGRKRTDAAEGLGRACRRPRDGRRMGLEKISNQAGPEK